jgi:hypothetical protein
VFTSNVSLAILIIGTDKVKATLDQLNDSIPYYSDKLFCHHIAPLLDLLSYFSTILFPYKAYLYPFDTLVFMSCLIVIKTFLVAQ